MRPKFAAFSRYRPRVLTVVVLLVVATLIVLANLSFDIRGVNSGDLYQHGGLRIMSHGWPLSWRRYFFLANAPGAGLAGGARLVACQNNAARLAGNVATWLVVLAGAGAACEWLVRRYRPRLRWSLRTMLVAVALAAVLCVPFAAARNRAKLQDPLIAAINGRIWVERSGPQWLDLLGADRFRRHIIGVEFGSNAAGADDKKVEEHLKQLARLPKLRYLVFGADVLTPGMVESLKRMPQLQRLKIEATFCDEGISHECLAAIGKMTRLEYLELNSMRIDDKSLDCLSGLTNLRSLWLHSFFDFPERSMFTRLPALPRLEAIDFMGSNVSGQDLRRLAVLPRLKYLKLLFVKLGADADLTALASLDSLEELTIDETMMSAAGIESLVALKRLKTLHMNRLLGNFEGLVELTLDDGNKVRVLGREAERFRQALQTLRRSKPGITLDSDNLFRSDGFEERSLTWDYDALADHHDNWLPASRMPSVPWSSIAFYYDSEAIMGLKW